MNTQSPVNILLVEDEPALGQIVKDSLQTRGFTVTLCQDGGLALSLFFETRPHILILDVMLPNKDGFTLAREIRAVNTHTPIIFLTAKSQTTDVVKGFELGGNDYLRKPFSMEELIVRVNALLRQEQASPKPDTTANQTYNIGQYTFMPTRHILSHSGKEKKLTHREAEILLRLYQNRNQVMERKAVLLDLWGDDNFFNARSMDVFITKLRKYLKADPTIEIINIRGLGYKLVM